MKIKFSTISKKVTSLFKKSGATVLALGLVVSLVSPLVPKAQAATSTSAQVTFTFDDGLASSLTEAAPTLAKYGYSGVNYVTTGCIGSAGICQANTDSAYMTWDQVHTLRNTYGWEIGSHTQTHPYLASSDADDGQPNVLTPEEVAQELVGSKADLAAQGINATSFATPYGDWLHPVLTQISAHYDSHRGFGDSIDQRNNVTGVAGPDGIIDRGNTFPYNDKLLYDLPVQAGVSVAQVKNYIDQTIANNQWLILTFHDIKQNASTNPDDYEYSTADLDAIAAYVKSKNIPVVTTAQGLANGTNMLADSTFDNGVSSNINDATVWSTDAPEFITHNTGGNGSYPSPANSVELRGTDKNIELFSPRVSVDASKTYVIKTFLNVIEMNVAVGHELAFYVDEYDAAGQWLQTVYKKSEVGNAGNATGAWIEDLNFEYKPTTPTTAQARLQVVVTANSGALAYIDNVRWFVETGVGGSGSVGKPGDVNGDLKINALDLSIMLSHWNQSGQTRATGDLSGDGKVNALDLSILLTNWNK